MNHYVPEFDTEDDYSLPTSAGLSRLRKASMSDDDEIMELLWKNGQFVTQNQRSGKKSSQYKYDSVIVNAQPSVREIQPVIEEPSASHQQQHLFIQEGEMASWLHYPLHDYTFDHDFCADLLYNAPSISNGTTTVTPSNGTVQVTEPPAADVIISSRPPIPPARRGAVEPIIVQNFALFSRQKARVEPEIADRPSTSKSGVRESTGVDSNDTPRFGSPSRISLADRSSKGVSGVNIGMCGCLSFAAVAGSSSAGAGKETTAFEAKISSSPDGSSVSAAPATKQPPQQPEDRKRKGRRAEDVDCQSEDTEFESADAKKQVCGSTSTKRSRAAEFHNLSERKRRDRINEKMKALQELIPCCNKSDKASMLDEAIEYLKSLQLQVQMMSMGYGMVPVMFPGVQQLMPPMGIGIGMGMQMGMSRPMMPFPNVLPGSGLPAAGAATHLGPRFPITSFHAPPVPSVIQTTNQSDAMINSLGLQNPSQPRVSNFSDPYQQFVGLHQMQSTQNQAMAQQSTNKLSAGKGAENHENHQSGAG